MKDPKKVAAGNRLAEWNSKNKENLTQPDEAQESEPKLSQAYSVRAVIAVVVLGLLCYYIYESKKDDNNHIKVTPVRSVETQKSANKFEME